MIVAILVDLSQDWLHHMQQSPLQSATMLRAASTEAAGELLQSVPADVLLLELQRITDERVAELQKLSSLADETVLVCIAPEEVIERFKLEELAEPDLWLPAGADRDHRDDVLTHAVETATLRVESGAMNDGVDTGYRVAPEAEGRPPDLGAFNRLMGGLSNGFDLDRLFEALTDAVTQFSQCASYALLWEAEGGCLRVRRHRGVREEVVDGARLCPCDALPKWYRRNRRVLTIAELADWSDRRQAVQVKRELEVLGAQIAFPLMVRGRLAGVLMLGEKMLGESYARDEVETLFGVINHVALAAQGVELHRELGRSKAYMESIVQSMAAGLITMGTDERITLCNPYAAEALGLSPEEIEGADLRGLPSPLGDMLYAALKNTEGEPTTDEVTIRGGEKTLRVSTSCVHDETGETLGSVLMLDDITAERELASERNRRERLDVLTRIVGRIAHEVKNPLTAVKTYAELLPGRGDDERLARFWSEAVLPEIDRLDEMLQNLLRMVEEPEPHVEPVRVEDLLSEALDVLSMEPEEKGQLFDLTFAEDLPSVLVDPVPMRDAISYLLSYLAGSQPYAVQVEVKPLSKNSTGVTVKMTRRSTANGQFDPETLFDPLTALQDPDTDLGPVISRKIITNQRGQVDARCESGRVTMRVMLPVSEKDASSDQEVH